MKQHYIALFLAMAALTQPVISNVAQAADEAPVAAPAAVSSAPVANAEVTDESDEFKMFRFSLRMDKLDFVKKAMGLNAEQEKKFFDQYVRYDIELKALNDARLAIVEDYAANFEKITDKDADKLVKRSLAFRKDRTKLLEKYYAKIAKVTSKVIAARFLQVESVLQGSSDVVIGSSIPLMSK
ncbi:MAG: hypothetical protein Q8Q50_07210 [Methylobacter sp.]|nr:hypothetical protein [Methylobacter sp.]